MTKKLPKRDASLRRSEGVDFSGDSVCMVPAGVTVRPDPLPRNPNGKIDRKALASEFLANASFTESPTKVDACPEGSSK